jgi:acyl transferase domain-containing protein/acyl carrier protein
LVLSGLTGTWMTGQQATDPEYWVQQMCQPVQFASGLDLLLQQDEWFVLEVGPGQNLGSLLKGHPACSPARRALIAATLPAAWEARNDQETLLEALGALWLGGVQVDWASGYREERRQRLWLPTYPFERKRYWIEAPASQHTSPLAHKTASPEKKANMTDWFYTSTWRQSALVTTAAKQRELRGPYLVFLDKYGPGESLATRLEQNSRYAVTRVHIGERFERLGTHDYMIRPAEDADYVALLADLATTDQTPRTILHCWSYTEDNPSPTNVETFKALQNRGFYSLLYLVQALEMHLRDETVQIITITNRALAITASEMLQPEKTTLPGAGKVIAQESTSIAYRNFDITEYSDPALIEQLLTECATAPSSHADLLVAYRGTRRWVQTYEPQTLASAEAPCLRKNGVYLITGGLGGIGLVLAQHLASNLQARLVLTGRTGLPSRSEWDTWLASHPDHDTLSRKIKHVRAMEEQGAQVLVLAADVASEDQLQEVMQQIDSHFGELHGVIHAAGIADPRAHAIVREMKRDDCELHFQPKVYGLLNLERALGERQLDFCLLYSSISAILGGLGFVAYTAANLFMDALTHQHNQGTASRWQSVNWDTWQVKEEDPHGVLGATVAVFAMRPEEGIEAFQRVLASDANQLINSTGDLQGRMQQWLSLEAWQENDEPAIARQDNLGHAATQPTRSDYEKRLLAIWQQVLGIEQIDLYENFFDVGGNSLIALQLISKIRKAFHVQIPITAIFEAPTISAMATLLQPEETQSEVQHNKLTRRRAHARHDTGSPEIAIIGMSGRFPGASTLEQYWQNLHNGVESITFFTDEELIAAGVDPEILRDPNYVKARPILDNVADFDAAFFGYSPREAEIMDPQHRLFMECSWEALEQAGYNARTYDGHIGMFGGTNNSTYLSAVASQREIVAQLKGVINDYQVAVGNEQDSLATSISYKLNLKGPSLSVQTFCSTSLVAVHLAIQSLLNGECDMALAGGVSIRVPAKQGHFYHEGGMESPDGHCRTFDARAKGSLFGDGVGVVALKRLSDALEDGDAIHAVIKGSAINNDGSLKVSYSAPSVAGQAEVVMAALARAGVKAEAISYVEAHGTATELGDPIEVASLTRAFRSQTEKSGYCAIGSVKTNIGHLDRAAGISGLLKTVLALKHHQIPPSLHYSAPNPAIDFEHSPFYVNTRLTDWETHGQPRIAGLNSLGMGGTNVHMIIAEAPESTVALPAARDQYLLLLSARTESALEAETANIQSYLAEHPESNFADVAYTLQVGRASFEHRRAFVCRDRDTAIATLEGKTSAPVLNYIEQRTDRPVTFLFPGLGEQYVGMAYDLYLKEEVFREQVDRCSTILKAHIGVDLREVLYPKDEIENDKHGREGLDLRALLRREKRSESAATQRLKQTGLAQPAVFVIEYALARLLMQWGIRPQAMIGYSLGEYVAACLAGVFSLEDALLLVSKRARLIQEQPAGAMVAVALSEQDIQPYLSAQLCLAVLNSPASCVVSGPLDAIRKLELQLEEQEIVSRRLETTHAFHSTMLDPVRESLTALVSGVTLHAPQIPYVSNVTGTWITAEQAMNPAYWAQHMCQTVRFADGLEQILQDPETLFLEIGAGQSLGSFVKQHPMCGSERLALILPTLPAAFEHQSASTAFLTTLARLWLAGVPIDWQGFYGREQRQRLHLPTYPFERKRFWLLPEKVSSGTQEQGNTLQAIMDKELPLKADIADWFYVPSWKQSRASVPFAHEAFAGQQFCWLLFADDSGLHQQLRQELLSRNQEVITLVPGESFSLLTQGVYTVRPTSREDYTTLLQEMRSQGKRPQKVVHLWNITPEHSEQLTDKLLDAALDASFYSLLAFVQALGDGSLDPCEITVISNHMQDILGTEKISPEKATLTGPVKVIPQEYNHIRCRSLDISFPLASNEQALSLLQQILGELTTPIDDMFIALRGNYRWVQTFEPLRVDGRGDYTPALRSGGTYLITGGLGGIGLALAEHLIRTVQANVILVGRKELPPRDEWPQILALQGEKEGTGYQISQLQTLESLGTGVLALSADVTNEEHMRRVVEQATATFGTIHGIFHAAAIPPSGLAQLKTPDMAATVLGPKVKGTLILERVTQHIPLDFRVMFSSISSATGGGPGQIDYCAANAFLDAYAHAHASGCNLTITINWGEWRWDAWGKGLEGFPEEAQAFFREKRRRFGISFEDGMEALKRAMERRIPHISVATQDLPSMVEGSKNFSISAIFDELHKIRQAAPSHPRPVLGTAYVSPETEVEQEIASIWSELLGIDQIGVEDNFFALGGHSLIGTQLILRLRKAFQVDLPLTMIFEASTIAELAVEVDLKLIEEIEQMDEEEVKSMV